jgi:photosystem II stability/assembly factor-like uncharacterized protein
MKKSFISLGVGMMALVLAGQGCISLGGNQASGTLGMFVSADRGVKWSAVSLLPTAEGVQSLAQASVYRIVDDPQDPRTMYWLSRADGLLYTYTDGKSWMKAPAPLSKGFIYALAVHPKDKCTLVASNGTEVYRSDDCSRSWKEIYRESRATAIANALAFNPFAPHEIFLGESNGDLLASVDSGVSWRVVNRFKSGIASIELDSHQENLLYVATRSQGLHRSEDGGAKWISLQDAMKDFPNADEYRRFAVHAQKTNILYWISTYGILISRDRGAGWRALPLITPPGSAQIYGFAVNPSNENEMYYTATINNRSTFYKTVDGGEHWVTNRLPSGQLPTALRVHPDQADVIYAGFTLLPKQN